MLKATIEDLISWKPCYSEAQVRALAGDVTEFTALDVLKRDDIPAQDRLWVVLRTQLIDGRMLRIFACDCAERALPKFEQAYPEDKRPRHAIEVARRYADGKSTDEELVSARAAADAAADAAYAARAAADAVADAAERDWQVSHLIEVLNG